MELTRQVWAETGGVGAHNFNDFFYAFSDDHNLDAPGFVPGGSTVENICSTMENRRFIIGRLALRV